ncbi:aminotransferase class V-fold PLP-dependent enzyme [Acidiferrobacter sp.]|uniref:cysteine desulfurase family protein n=1 Tax=Acidiferrobacter sp. TaxID=1872107 RepID=UPI002627B552|nr:aminotransferase class V-fold PLP-dependent enzyme [Acidiferrobacter sp.]
MENKGLAHTDLDHNATGTVARECLEAMLGCLQPGIGNPSSAHAAGMRAKGLLQESRAEVARLIGAQSREIVFTSSGTEANHTAILGILTERPDRRHIVTSRVEHPATLRLLRHLEGSGVRVTYLPVDGEGRLAPSAVREAITPDTGLVTLMWANNETGVLFPIPEIAEATQAVGVAFHVDAVQAAGRVPIDVARVPVDMLSLSGHKLHAPPGAGALFVRKGLKIAPLLYGHQERGLRGGTENLPAIVAFARACALARADLTDQAVRIARLRNDLEQAICDRFPFARVHGALAPRLPNTSNIGFGTLDGERIMTSLDRRGIAVSLGAACAAGGMEPSHVLMAMGLDRQAALAAIRFSFGRYNTHACVDRVLAHLPEILREAAARVA